MNFLDPEFVLSFGVAAFLAIVFLQSGLDKVFDFSGNLEFISGMFANAPVPVPVLPLLIVVTIFEVAAGALSAVGAVVIFFSGDSLLAYWGAILSAVSLLMVLSGQRLARAYADAAVIAPYFLVSCLGIYILG
ncbi:MAG: DoxX family protein [Deltaproteobacteria bacterium]|nr:DoxX family protein [Deltaproteobacteria bacterium]